VTEGTNRTVSWTYDNIYRLTNETIGNDPANKNGSITYGLDPVGNRQSETSGLSGLNPGSFAYTADDELSTDTYDNNGNTTHSGVNSFTFDSENHLMSMNGGAVTLVYDGDGNRVAKTVSSGTTMYLVDDLNPTGLPQVVDEIVGGAVQRTFTYGLQRISENQFVSSGWTPSFYEYDGEGSVRQLTGSAGSPTDTYEYDAFGNEINHTGTTANNYLYRGEQYDPDLSLYYLRARYYNPLTGRFLSVDSQASEGQRRYEYAAADPVNGMDPTGNNDIIEFELLNFQPSPIMSWPKFCWVSGSTAMGAFLPGCGDGSGGGGGGGGGGPHGRGGGPPGPPPGPPPPPCKCGLKTAPQYDKFPSVRGGTVFSWHASFLNDATHKPDCCEVRQMISWNHGPAPSWFYPPDNQANTWYEDRDQANHRYGRRNFPYEDLGPNNYYSGDDYDGSDAPRGLGQGITFKFKLIVVDICNHDSVIFTSKVLNDNF